MRLLRTLAVAIAAAGSTCAAQAAPYAVLDFDGSGMLQVVDLASVHKAGSLVRYEAITLMQIPPELADPLVPDEVHLKKEADCAGRRVRLLEMSIASGGGQPRVPPWAEAGDWTEVDPAELRLVCEGNGRGKRGMATLGAARDLLRSAGARR